VGFVFAGMGLRWKNPEGLCPLSSLVWPAPLLLGLHVLELAISAAWQHLDTLEEWCSGSGVGTAASKIGGSLVRTSPSASVAPPSRLACTVVARAYRAQQRQGNPPHRWPSLAIGPSSMALHALHNVQHKARGLISPSTRMACQTPIELSPTSNAAILFFQLLCILACFSGLSLTTLGMFSTAYTVRVLNKQSGYDQRTHRAHTFSSSYFPFPL
jgi:hypothetical protein